MLLPERSEVAALLEHSSHSCGLGFAEARRVLRPGGRVVTIALVPLSAKRLRATGFELEATYKLPALNAGVCNPEMRVYAQVARTLTAEGSGGTGADEEAGGGDDGGGGDGTRL